MCWRVPLKSCVVSCNFSCCALVWRVLRTNIAACNLTGSACNSVPACVSLSVCSSSAAGKCFHALDVVFIRQPSLSPSLPLPPSLANGGVCGR